MLTVDRYRSPSPSPGPDDPTIRVKVRRTFLIITQKPDGKTMEISQSAPLFDIAMDQIRTNLRIAREQKKSTVLPGPFTLDYGELRYVYSEAPAVIHSLGPLFVQNSLTGRSERGCHDV